MPGPESGLMIIVKGREFEGINESIAFQKFFATEEQSVTSEEITESREISHFFWTFLQFLDIDTHFIETSV